MLTSPEERGKWLMNKAEQHGFKILWVREDGQSKAFVRKNNGLAVHTGVKFRGELEIINEDKFQKAFCNGIGAGKAYGMGMLMLFPARG
jgi:CRISPR system Cascade subunit CasE